MNHTQRETKLLPLPPPLLGAPLELFSGSLFPAEPSPTRSFFPSSRRSGLATPSLASLGSTTASSTPTTPSFEGNSPTILRPSPLLGASKPRLREGEPDSPISIGGQKRLGTVPVTLEEMDELIARMQHPVASTSSPASRRSSRSSNVVHKSSTAVSSNQRSPDKLGNRLDPPPGLSPSGHTAAGVHPIEAQGTVTQPPSVASEPVSDVTTAGAERGLGMVSSRESESLARLIASYKAEELARRAVRILIAATIPRTATSIKSVSALSLASPLPALPQPPADPLKPSAAVSTLPAATRPRIKTIEEIIREGGGEKLGANGPTTLTPAQLVIKSTRSAQVAIAGEEPEERETLREKSEDGYLPPLPRASPLFASQDGLFDTYSLQSATSLSRSQTSTSSGARGRSGAREQALALYLSSARLTRLYPLQAAPHVGTVVSFADVGDVAGKPVVVFLGLGCVRYLVALYDEWAKSLGLRLICIDRWGLGKSSDIAQPLKSYSHWASLLYQVVMHLSLAPIAILAHSAGAPYALAFAERYPHLVYGPIHLLAPWGGGDEGESLIGGYKVLGHLPKKLLRGAQAAEWKVQAWRLGKPPKVQHAPIGFNHTRSTSATSPPRVLRKPPSPLAKRNQLPRDDSRLSCTSSATEEEEEEEEATIFVRNPQFSQDLDRNILSPQVPPTATRSRKLSLGTGGGWMNSVFRKSTSLPRQPAVRHRRVASVTSSRASSRTSSSGLPSADPQLSALDLVNGVLRASHAESAGASSDLLVLLAKPCPPPKGSDNPAAARGKVLIWYGDRDDRITLASITRLQAGLPQCEVKIIPGADHSLMTSSRVVIDVLDAIASTSTTSE